MPQCKYDDPHWYDQYRKELRARQWAKVIEEEGLTVEKAAARFGITKRHFYRIKRLVKLDGDVL